MGKKKLSLYDVKENPDLYPEEYKAIKAASKQLGEQIQSTLDYYNNEIAQITKLFENVGKQLKHNPLLEFMAFADEKNFSIAISAADGNKESLQKLSRIWWRKLFNVYFAVAKQEHTKPTIQGFMDYIHQHCWKIITPRKNEILSTQLVINLPKDIFNSVSNELENTFIKNKSDNVSINNPLYDVAASLEVFDNTESNSLFDKFISSSNITLNDITKNIVIVDGKKYLFLRTVSQILNETGSHVTVPTLRNLVKQKRVTGRKIKWILKTGVKVDAYIIEYTNDLFDRIKKLKRDNERKRSHSKEGLITTGQFAKYLKVSVRTLQRHIKSNKMKPTLIENKVSYFSIDYIREFHKQNKQRA